MAFSKEQKQLLLTTYNSKDFVCKDFKKLIDKLINVRCEILYRCYSKKDTAYERYGAKGTRVCDEWINNPMNFYIWALNNGYDYVPSNKGINTISIDRINTRGNYEPNNCRWTTSEEQANNRVSNICINDNGIRLTVAQYSEKYNKNSKTIYKRLSMGWDIQDAISKPIRRKNEKRK